MDTQNTDEIQHPLLYFLRKKLLGSILGVVFLAIAPFLWALLAFNTLVIAPADSFPGEPLASNSLTICLYRFAGASVLGVITGLILVLVSPGLRILRLLKAIALFSFKYWRVIVKSSLWLGIALPAFFIGFQKIGVVMTSVIAVGIVPFFTVLFDWGTVFHRRVRNIKPRTGYPPVSGFDWVALALMFLTLTVFLLLTFDTINITRWSTILEERGAKLGRENPFDLLWGIPACMVYGFGWSLFLREISNWPTRAEEDVDHSNLMSRPSLETIYNQLRPECPVRPLSTPLVLLVKVGLCQAIAGLFALALVYLFSPWVAMFSATISDIQPETLASRLQDVSSPRGVILALILLLPSFGAYYFLNHASEQYDERRIQAGSAVSASAWNNLLSFVSPFVATLLSIYFIGRVVGGPELSEAWVYGEFVNWIVPTVGAAYAVVFFVKFLGIFEEVFGKAVASYQQKLQKIFTDALSVAPWMKNRALTEAGMKEDDLQKIETLSRPPDPSLSERMLCYHSNVREQALLHLTSTLKWRSGCSFRVPGVTDGHRTTILMRLPAEESDQTDPPNLIGSKGWQLLERNFRAPRSALLREFDVWICYFPMYSEALPAHTSEWRDIEKAIYFELTGSVWFKSQRYKHVTPLSVITPGKAPHNAAERIQWLTRGFLELDDAEAALEGLNESGCEELPWPEFLRPLFFHLLDWDHMLKGVRADIIGSEISDGDTTTHITDSDKIIFLLAPKQKEFPGLRTSNPLWPEAPSTADENRAARIHRQLAKRFNEFGSKQSQVAFRERIFINGWVIGHDSVESP